MRTAVAETSIISYYAMGAAKLNRQQQQIVTHLAKHCQRDWTRLELSEAIPMRLSSVTARCNELVATHVLIDGDARRCLSSGRSAHPLSLAPLQQDMFT